MRARYFWIMNQFFFFFGYVQRKRGVSSDSWGCEGRIVVAGFKPKMPKEKKCLKNIPLYSFAPRGFSPVSKLAWLLTLIFFYWLELSIAFLVLRVAFQFITLSIYFSCVAGHATGVKRNKYAY